MNALDDLSVNAIDGRTDWVRDLTVSESSPGLLVMVLLKGSHRLVIDGQALDLQAGEEGGDGKVVLLNTTRPSRLHRDPGQAAAVRSVTIAAPHAWLDRMRGATTETDPVLQDFLSTHRAQLTVPASRQIRHLAAQIYNPPPTLGGEVQALHRKARALDILCQAFATVSEHGGARPRPRLASRRRSERVRDYVLANLGTNLTIETIAAEIGASVSSVQRHFKEHFRMTVFEFIRSERLAQACAALERDGVTIAQAAYAAGYADPSNFTVAFKRAYGVLPKHRRR